MSRASPASPDWLTSKGVASKQFALTKQSTKIHHEFNDFEIPLKCLAIIKPAKNQFSKQKILSNF